MSKQAEHKPKPGFDQHKAVQKLVERLRKTLPKTWGCDDPYLENWNRGIGRCYKIRIRPNVCPCCGQQVKDDQRYISMILGDNGKFMITTGYRSDTIYDVTKPRDLTRLFTKIKSVIKKY